jgi:hypothetical protein
MLMRDPAAGRAGDAITPPVGNNARTGPTCTHAREPD